MDTLFFIVSKIAWLLISPDMLFVLLLVCCLVLLWCRARKAMAVLLHIAVIFAVVVTLLPVGDWLLYPIEKQFLPMKNPPAKVDGIIVLAGPENLDLSKVWQQPELNDSAERIFAFIHLCRKYPEAQKIYTGGSGSLSEQQYKATQVAKQLLTLQGMDTTDILFESRSRNTYENALYSKQMIAPSTDETWLLITSASHMPRSMGIFYKLGWNVIPYTVDHRTHPENLFRLTPNFRKNLKRLAYAVREWIGLTAYFLTGKTTDLLPSPASTNAILK